MPGNSTEKDSCIRAATNWIHTHPKLSWREFKVNKLNFRVTGGKAVIPRGKRTPFLECAPAGGQNQAVVLTVRKGLRPRLPAATMSRFASSGRRYSRSRFLGTCGLSPFELVARIASTH